LVHSQIPLSKKTAQNAIYFETFRYTVISQANIAYKCLTAEMKVKSNYNSQKNVKFTCMYSVTKL